MSGSHITIAGPSCPKSANSRSSLLPVDAMFGGAHATRTSTPARCQSHPNPMMSGTIDSPRARRRRPSRAEIGKTLAAGPDLQNAAKRRTETRITAAGARRTRPSMGYRARPAGFARPSELTAPSKTQGHNVRHSNQPDQPCKPNDVRPTLEPAHRPARGPRSTNRERNLRKGLRILMNGSLPLLRSFPKRADPGTCARRVAFKQPQEDGSAETDALTFKGVSKWTGAGELSISFATYRAETPTSYFVLRVNYQLGEKGHHIGSDCSTAVLFHVKQTGTTAVIAVGDCALNERAHAMASNNLHPHRKPCLFHVKH
jgi:hypothetical protein